MTATIGAATSGSRPELINATYGRLRRMDFADPEAANLTGLKNGFGITSQPWTIRELAHLLFLRESRRIGRRWSDADDRVHASDATRMAVAGDRAPAPTVVDRASVPVAPSRNRRGAEPADRAVTLLTLFRSIAGPDATLDLLRLSAPLRPDAADDVDREAG